jgi:flagellar protein FliS
MKNAAQAYLKTQVNTVGQNQLLVLLYEGAEKFLTQAKEKIAEKDYAAKGILISKAIDIISELDESLNAQKGGELAQNLHNLYFYCNTRLLKANVEMNTELIDEVLKILSAVKSAFREIDSAQNGAAVPTGIAPEPPQQEAAPESPPEEGQAAESGPDETADRSSLAGQAAYQRISLYK